MSRTSLGITQSLRLGLGILIALVPAFMLLLSSPMAARAAQFHPEIHLEPEFNGSETPAGGMVPFGLAIDNSSSASAGDVYVTDYGSEVIDKFDKMGSYLTTMSEKPGGGHFVGGFRAQNSVNASGDLFVGDTAGHVVDEFSPSGEPLEPQIVVPNGEPVAVAIDSSGKVLIATAQTVYRYDPSSSEVSVFATETNEGGFGEVNGVAVDDDPSSPAFGDVYIVDSGAAAVDVFNSSGTYQSRLTGTPRSAFGFIFRDVVDPTTGELYVTTEGAVDEFGPTGTFVSQIPIPGGFPATVGINAKTGELYVGDIENGRVDVFGPAVTIPDVGATGTSNIQPASATVKGQVDPVGGGNVTSCEVEYGTSMEYGQTAVCAPATPYAGATEVSVDLSGLTPDTVYHFRFVAHNANGIDNMSEDATFETTGPPSVGEQSTSVVTRTSATLQARLDPHGFETEYHFEYGTTANYGTSVPVPDASIEAGQGEQEVGVGVGGLAVGMQYHFRLVATSGAGTVYGPDATFSTSPVATVEGLAALAGSNDATLRVKVEDFGTPSDCEVEYVTEAQYLRSEYASPTIAQCTPQHLGGEMGALQAIVRLGGLDAGTTYHYRYVISNEFGEERSADQAFITFGLAAFSLEALEQGSNGHYDEVTHMWSEESGLANTEAGAHPFVLTTNLVVNTNVDHLGNIEGPAGTVKDIRVHLPVGLIGNPQAVEQCTRYDSERQECSAASQIGVITVLLIGNGTQPFTAPLFNIVPPRGVAAEFSARFSKAANAFIDSSVRTGSDYGIDATSLNISTKVPVAGARVRIWGVPADPRHRDERQCPTGNEQYGAFGCDVSLPLRPFLTNPTSCTAKPLSVGAEVDTYQMPGEFAQRDAEMPAMTGCARLHFAPTITVQPEVSSAASPSGLHVDLHIPQEESAVGLAEADLKDATVVLPKGLMVNPASAGGRTGCSEVQIELNGPKPAVCPDSSKVGTVELTSPLVDHPLRGDVYVAQQGNGGPAQGSNKFNSLIALYVAIDDPQTGVVVKLAGDVSLDPATGQLTTTFKENPQLPFEDLKLDFFGGPRAALQTPPACGSYEDGSAVFASWAEPGSPVAPGLAPFVVSSGPGGSACPSGAFAPGFTAGTESGQAGAFTPFVLSFSRQDGEQDISGLEATLAPGLLGKLAGIPLCGDAEAAAGACPATSQIGTVTASAGAGADPVSVQGQVFLTGPYNGGPFGEVVEVPAIAGPFNLGTVVVRGSIRINPTTAQASVVSDAFPTMLKEEGAGVPVSLKRVVVTLDRPGFTFNPTNCDQLAVTGNITGTGGAKTPVSAPFQVSNCAKLPFKPTFAVSTQAKSSKAGGASLHVKLGPLHEGPQTSGASGSSSSSAVSAGGEEANIARVKVDLPKILPSRLTTLQKACTSATFDANPANCPAASIVGSAVAHTPLLASPVSGPAYFVSHGNEAFPQLVVVLQGEGITVDLVGDTFISKGGITSSTFAHVPDVPVTTFELILPQGKYSALAANGNLCKNSKKLKMPTEFVAQNGAKIHESTKISVTGCPKAKKAKHKAKKHKKTRKG